MSGDEEVPKVEEEAPAEAKEESKEEEAKEEKGEGKEEAPAKSPKAKSPKKDKRKAEADDGDDDENVNTGTYWNVGDGGKRQRKSLEHFHPESSRDKEDVVGKVLGAGKGEALSTIPAVVAAIKDHAISKSDPKDPLKVVSKLIFNKTFQARELKENLLAFSGMVFADDKNEENWTARVHKKTVAEIKQMLGCLHLERSGNHSDLADRLCDFLKKPSAEMADKGVAVAGSKKKSSAKKKPADAKGKPKGKSAAKKKASKKDEDSDDDDEEEEEEEEEEAPKAKKGKASKKKDDDDDSDADVPLGTVAVESKLQKSIQAICSKQDLSTLTLRIVRDQLESDYQVDIVENKELIKKLVNDWVGKNS